MGDQGKKTKKKTKETAIGPVKSEGPAPPPAMAKSVEKKIIDIIKWVAIILGIIFTFIALKDVKYDRILEIIGPLLLTKAALLLYYFSWVFGAKFDTKVFGWGFPPSAPIKIPFKAYPMMIAVPAIFVVLAWLSLTPEYAFTFWPGLALMAFWLFNVFSNWWMHRVVLGSTFSDACEINKSNKDYFSCQKLHECYSYHLGAWQKIRFCAGLVLSCLYLLMLLGGFQGHVSIYVNRLAGYLRIFDINIPYISPETVVALYLFLFVLSMEGWMMLKRYNLNVIADKMDFQEHNYSFSPKFNFDMCRINKGRTWFRS